MKEIVCDNCVFCNKFELMDNYEEQWNREEICIYCKHLQDRCEKEMENIENELRTI